MKVSIFLLSDERVQELWSSMTKAQVNPEGTAKGVSISIMRISVPLRSTESNSILVLLCLSQSPAVLKHPRSHSGEKAQFPKSQRNPQEQRNKVVTI